MINIGNDWQLFFDNEQNQPYYEDLRKFLKQEYATHTVYPPMDDIFNAFKLTDLPDVKVVILGQDCLMKTTAKASYVTDGGVITEYGVFEE